MSEIKYRQWGEYGFHYWGFIKPGVFIAPCTLNGCQENAEKNSQQFTGLKDKNGKKIYEGDIVAYDFKNCGGEYKQYIGTVFFHAPGFRLKPENNWDNQILPWLENIGRAKYDLEIIGNIHETPDLLKP